ncbi:MAG: hypothetical protein HXS53_04575 [Theionarchaea archaeon]|nr:hypothetical protein [Theionarchaea archaeon]
MDEEDKSFYYGIILACIIGIAATSIVLIRSVPPQEEFTELYLHFERIDLTDNVGQFNGREVHVSEVIWIDIDTDAVQDAEELFIPGDTFILDGEFWNISDVAKDRSQILFGKFPKDVTAGEINFTFVIVNHLGDSHAYTYTVLAGDFTLTESVTIKKGERMYVSETISVDSDVKVIVTLDTGEDIYFYLRVS